MIELFLVTKQKLHKEPDVHECDATSAYKGYTVRIQKNIAHTYVPAGLLIEMKMNA